jgi:hypothetical protein
MFNSFSNRFLGEIVNLLSCYQSALMTGYNSSRLFSTATALRGGAAEISTNATDTALAGIIEGEVLKMTAHPERN